MFVYKWFLPTLSEILVLSTETEAEQPQIQTERATSYRHSANRIAQRRIKAERDWCGAIAALEALLQQRIQSSAAANHQPAQPQGLVLAGPLPVLSTPILTTQFSTWTFTSELLNALALMPFQLLPTSETQSDDSGRGLHCPNSRADSRTRSTVQAPTASTSPLLPGDPLAAEQFCLVLTPKFSLVMVLGEDGHGDPAFLFSFDPEVVQQAWQCLRARALLTSSQQVRQLDTSAKPFVPVEPDYKLVMQFSRLLLQHLPESLDWEAKAPGSSVVADSSAAIEGETTLRNLPAAALRSHPDWADLQLPTTSLDMELLQAIAHEVRTPLATIRTLTRLLLKRQDLAPDVLKRLEIIDHECTEQIDRFGLIFRAVELETSTPKQTPVHLTPTSLNQVFQQGIPRWQKQASRRNITLNFVLPQKMPTVVSDPTMLDQVLTGLIERFTRHLPAGSHIQVQAMLAGNQLKLQLQSQLCLETGHPEADPGHLTGVQNSTSPLRDSGMPILKSIGQLLMFHPETGRLSLNLAVTKNLFQALGGKLIVRQRPQQGEVMTVFLPLDGSSTDNVVTETAAGKSATPHLIG